MNGITAKVLATEMAEQTLPLFNLSGLPVVFLDAYFEQPDYNFVLINNAQGAYLATKHLIQKCHVQPGCLRSSYWISNFDARADGFYKAIREAGMAAAHSQVLRLAPSQEGAYEDMKTLLKEMDRPAPCYFADNDLIAIGARQVKKNDLQNSSENGGQDQPDRHGLRLSVRGGARRERLYGHPSPHGQGPREGDAPHPR